MTFTDVPAGAAIFVDANILIYHFTAHPVFGPPCTDLLHRIERQELTGYTSAAVVADVAHRLTTLEAHQLFSWPMTGIVHRLKSHPQEVQQLNHYRMAIDEISAIGLQVIGVPGALVSL